MSSVEPPLVPIAKEEEEVLENLSHIKLAVRDKNPGGTEPTSDTSEDRRKEPAIPEAPDEVDDTGGGDVVVRPVDSKKEEKEENTGDQKENKKKKSNKKEKQEDTVCFFIDVVPTVLGT